MGQHTSRADRSTANADGVTAVELVVVIVIVVALAVVALTAVTGIRSRQRSSACKDELRKVQTAVEAYRALPKGQNPTGDPPRSLNVLKGAGLLDQQIGEYVAYSRVRSGGRLVPHYANGPKGNCVVS